MELAGNRAQRAAGVALLVTIALTLAKLLLWVATDSLAVLSQTLDSALDIVALGLVYLAVRLAEKPADESHHYGHAKAENLAAFTQTLFLGAIVVGVGFEAAGRLSRGTSDVGVPWYAFAVFGASAVIDVVRVRALLAAARAEASSGLKAGALNLATDVGTAVVTLFSLALVRVGFARADAAGGLLVAVAVVVAAIRLGKASVDVLMDRAPVAPVGAIEAAAAAAPGVAEARRVRVRESGKQLFADVTVAAGRTTSLERAHDIAENVEREIDRVAPGADVVVHVEPISETTGFVERVQAAASRAEGVHEVHNVLVHAFEENGASKLHVTLHAKVTEAISLGSAHDVSDRIEEAVERELGTDVRVDTHIEPLHPGAPGTDVTADRQDVVNSVRALAIREDTVVDCHEVIVTSTDGHLAIVAHVRGRADLPLARIHAASDRIEKSVHAAHAEVASVLIHFEPA